jgi:hypothetical protein
MKPISRGLLVIIGVLASVSVLTDSAYAQAPAQQPRPRLKLGSGQFDPRATPSLTIRPDQPSHRRYLIHLDEPLTAAQRATLVATGVGVGEYLPDNAYVVRLGPLRPADLARFEFIKWVGRFGRPWKIDATIGRRPAISPERVELAAAGRARVVVHLFSKEKPAATLVQLRRIGATVRDVQIPDEHAQLEVDLPLDKMTAVADMEEVMFVEDAPEAQPRNASTAWVSQSNVTDSTPIWDAALHGEGQMAGIIDWNLRDDHCMFSDVSNPIGPLHRKIQAYYGGPFVPPGSGGSTHGTHVSGVLAGEDPAHPDPNDRGMAYKSRFVFQHLSAVLTATNLNDRLTIAHVDGASVHSNSWGNSETTYNAWARDIDIFTRNNEDDLVLVATDNFGIVKAPENAKNCIAVAAASDAPSQDSFCYGGLGPTADGRRKPDLMAVGCGSISANAFVSCGMDLPGGGTSYATPAVSGMALLVRQYFMSGFYPGGSANAPDAVTPTGALMKAVLVNSTVDMTGIGGYPSSQEGWGRLLVGDALYFAGDARKLIVHDVRNGSGLSTGQSTSYQMTVASNAQPLKITLVWTDAPASPGASFTPINNLDLVVTAPDASVYKGNVFSAGQSATGGSADTLNNVEQVHRTSPVSGTYTIDVAGTQVLQPTQGYALVVTGDLLTIDCAAVTPGDVSGDLLVNGDDAQPFVQELMTFSGTITTAQQCASDIGSAGDPCSPDGLVNDLDIPGFVQLLLTGSCP